MPRLKLILNPTADHGHAREIGPPLREMLEAEAQVAAARQGRAYELVWTQTQRPRHAIELARDAANEGFDAVVAIGGDGTVHEVVNGLMQVDGARRPRLGVIPAGSGNDFAHNFGLPATQQAAARCLLGDTTRPVDIGVIEDNNGRRAYWDNTIGIGFSGVVNIVARRYGRWRGFLLYLIAVLESIMRYPQRVGIQLTADGNSPIERRVAMVSLCNGPREGGGFAVAPDAVMTDGLITYTIMRAMSRANMLRFLPVVMNGKHLAFERYFESGTAGHIRIEADQTMAVHTDGEVFGPFEAGIRHLEVSLLPGALDVLTEC